MFYKYDMEGNMERNHFNNDLAGHTYHTVLSHKISLYFDIYVYLCTAKTRHLETNSIIKMRRSFIGCCLLCAYLSFYPQIVFPDNAIALQ